MSESPLWEKGVEGGRELIFSKPSLHSVCLGSLSFEKPHCRHVDIIMPWSRQKNTGGDRLGTCAARVKICTWDIDPKIASSGE